MEWARLIAASMAARCLWVLLPSACVWCCRDVVMESNDAHVVSTFATLSFPFAQSASSPSSSASAVSGICVSRKLRVVCIPVVTKQLPDESLAAYLLRPSHLPCELQSKPGDDQQQNVFVCVLLVYPKYTPLHTECPQS